MTMSLTSTSPGQGACAAGDTEHVTTGIVTGGTSNYTLTGDPVKFKVCEDGSGNFTIVPGQKLKM